MAICRRRHQQQHWITTAAVCEWRGGRGETSNANQFDIKFIFHHPNRPQNPDSNSLQIVALTRTPSPPPLVENPMKLSNLEKHHHCTSTQLKTVWNQDGMAKADEEAHGREREKGWDRDRARESDRPGKWGEREGGGAKRGRTWMATTNLYYSPSFSFCLKKSQWAQIPPKVTFSRCVRRTWKKRAKKRGGGRRGVKRVERESRRRKKRDSWWVGMKGGVRKEKTSGPILFTSLSHLQKKKTRCKQRRHLSQLSLSRFGLAVYFLNFLAFWILLPTSFLVHSVQDTFSRSLSLSVYLFKRLHPVQQRYSSYPCQKKFHIAHKSISLSLNKKILILNPLQCATFPIGTVVGHLGSRGEGGGGRN